MIERRAKRRMMMRGKTKNKIKFCTMLSFFLRAGQGQDRTGHDSAKQPPAALFLARMAPEGMRALSFVRRLLRQQDSWLTLGSHHPLVLSLPHRHASTRCFVQQWTRLLLCYCALRGQSLWCQSAARTCRGSAETCRGRGCVPFLPPLSVKTTSSDEQDRQTHTDRHGD